MLIWELIAERKIDEAMAEGAFDNLEGSGRPLALEENPFEDGSDRMANRILKNNGFAPSWIQESKDLDIEIDEIRTLARGAYRDARVRDLNRRIAMFNLTVPIASKQKRVITQNEQS